METATEVKKIRVLRIQFSGELAGHEIPAFRGAIAQKAGLENVLFHNHLGKTDFAYRYPLIQYKNTGGKPGILCIDEGVDEIHKFFQQKDWSLSISGRKLNMEIDKLNLNQFTMQVWDKMWEYRIIKWIALNKDNYQVYQSKATQEEQKQMLIRILTANILSFAKGIGWIVSKPIVIELLSLPETRPVKVKGNTMVGFTTRFKTNVFLPNYIGLGKSVSHGYGMVMGGRKGDGGNSSNK